MAKAKLKKQIKKLKREIVYLNDAHDAMHELTAHHNQDIDELNTKINSLQFQIENLQNIVGIHDESIQGLATLGRKRDEQLKSNIDELGKRIDDIDIQSQNDIRRDFLQAKIDKLKAQKCECHTNTQKTEKNATEGKQEGKNEHPEPTWFDESSELTQLGFEALKLKARSQANYEVELKKAYDNCFKYYDKYGNIVDNPEGKR